MPQPLKVNFHSCNFDGLVILIRSEPAMLFLLSPAKSLDYDTPAITTLHTQPRFKKEAAELIGIMREKTPAQVASLMGISDKLAALNVARYQAWSTQFTAKNSKQAALAFNGDVYDGLNAAGLSEDQLQWAQEHLLILSGLYGVLRPLDWMQPYRLEMGVKLVNPRGKDLYAYWQEKVTSVLNERLVQEKTPVVINLASEEYFKAVDTQALKARVVQCVFEEFKNGAYKIVSFYAKRARGLMMRYAIEKRAKTPQALQKFDLDGYAYDSAASDSGRMVFRRRQAA
jgi:cytoplasmic iron level regulating protein YaaA (DUF328/UPF0246 family)